MNIKTFEIDDEGPSCFITNHQTERVLQDHITKLTEKYGGVKLLDAKIIPQVYGPHQGVKYYFLFMCGQSNQHIY